MALPNRALLLIHDYSRPMTRPDWRKSTPIISVYKLYQHARTLKLYHNTTMRNKLVFYIVLQNMKYANWYNEP
jgi:hypothetical protein